MLLLLSPAKSLDFETPLGDVPHTQPQYVADAEALVALLRTKSPDEVASLMELSDALAALNVARYQAWRPRHTARNARPAALAFDGDVYGGLEARTLDLPSLRWAQRHVRILSGLYGVLRPLDRIQPYRLEMGRSLAGPHGANLYQYWGSRIAEHLNGELAGAKAPVVVNLASQEYFKVVDREALQARVVDCVFEEYKDGQYKIVSFFAKRARGLMARYAVEHRVATVGKLRAFDAEGYAYDAKASAADRLVFRRRQEA